ncbi:MAG TPA: WYL domain-containing protein [Candidatus Deferrimicrobiaceae bacterium]|jgi:predicted DNA-binding transcriptional regulator YafY|nr:WYL domain-containing protein [Candidatus Deferrimicrobiaceae bacterium]
MVVDQELDQMLRSAITNKRLLQFKYKGHERIVEPHDYGIQNGTVRLLCWQIGGRSGSRIPGWRIVDIDGMHDFEVLDKHFAGNRDILSGKHHRWDEVFIRVGPSVSKAS